MLPDPTVPPSLMGLLEKLGTFTSPSLRTFAALLTGMVAATGKKVFAAAWQHDGAAKGPHPVGRGTCFVVIGIVVELPFCSRPVCLPVMARLWRPRQGQSKVEIAASMVRLLAVCHHTRTLHVVADAAYHGKALRTLRDNVTFTTRLPANAVLYDLAPPPTGRRGRPALKGKRLGTPAELATTARFTKAQVKHYGRTDTARVSLFSLGRSGGCDCGRLGPGVWSAAVGWDCG